MLTILSYVSIGLAYCDEKLLMMLILMKGIENSAASCADKSFLFYRNVVEFFSPPSLLDVFSYILIEGNKG